MDKESPPDDLLHQVNDLYDSQNLDEHIYKLHLNEFSKLIEDLDLPQNKIKILDKLLVSQIIETKENQWIELSQILRKCFVSCNNEIFYKSLKIHHKIISYHNSSLDGFANLLRSTLVLLHSRNLQKSRLVQSLQLILEAQNVAIKLLLHSSRTLIDETLKLFVNILTFRSVFELLGDLAPDFNWLQNICYGSYIRHVFFSNLSPEFVKFVAASFTQRFQSGERFEHFGSFLLFYWQYNTKSSEIESETVLQSILMKNTHKKPETDFIVKIFTANPNLLTPKLLEILVEPLITNRTNLIFFETYSYLFQIVNSVAQSGNFQVLFGVFGVKKGRRNAINLPQKILDLAILALKSNENFIPLLLNCVVNIYRSHPFSLNPSKLIQTLRDFYCSNPTQNSEILSCFEFFLFSYLPTLRILEGDSIIMQDLFDFLPAEDLKNFVVRIGDDKNGFEFIKKHQRIVKTYLEEIWLRDDFNNDSVLVNFIWFIFVVKFSTRSTVAFFSEDDDQTVVESDERSITLGDLVEKSLNNFSDEEFLGLLVVKVCIMNLDLLLYLQTNYQVYEKLLEKIEEKTFIDEGRQLTEDILNVWDSTGFVGNIDSINVNNEFRDFLQNESSNLNDYTIINQSRRLFKSSLETFDTSRLALLLQKLPKTCVYRKIELNWPPSDSVYYQLHPEDFTGISIIINFGEKSNLLAGDKNGENLALLIKQSRTFIGHQPETFLNFDWFVGVVFLLCRGDLSQSKELLINFTKTQVTALVWSTFGKELDTVLQENFYQHFLVVFEENCCSFQAFKLLGVSPEMIVRYFFNQCFFNCLKFEEICHFLTFSVLYPAEFLIYYTVAIFQHLNDRICTTCNFLEVENFSQMVNLSGFQISNYILFIEQLSKRYRNLHKL